MKLTDEISKLHDLHSSGALTDDEFVQAKARLLRGESTSPFSAPSAVERSDERTNQNGASYQAQIDRLNWQNDLERADREWEMERQQYLVRGKYGHTSVPTQAGSIFSGLLVVGFGIFWTIATASLNSSHSSASEPYGIITTVDGKPLPENFPTSEFFPSAPHVKKEPSSTSFMPLIGILLIIVGVVTCISGVNKASQYEEAHNRYQTRRDELLNREAEDSRRTSF